MNTPQLTTASGFDATRMRFSEPQYGSIPNTNPQISYKRINISTLYSDGSIGDLILPTEKVFSFGVSENKDPATGEVKGYVLPLCLYNKDFPTKQEKEWVETFNNIVEKCKDHLLSVKEEIEQYDLERNDLKKLNPLYYKKDKGKVVDGTGPTLYAKLIVSKKQDKVLTMFYDGNGENLDALSLAGKYCFAQGAIKIESIFIGNRISLQVKLYEAEVTLAGGEMKRLLRRPESIKRVLTSNNSNPLNNFESKNDNDSDSDKSISLSESESEDEVKPAPAPPVKKTVRRVVKKVNKKQ